MGYKALAIVILCIVLISGSNGLLENSKDPMVEAFNELQPEEKTDFISYFLALGLRDWAKSQLRPPKFASQTSDAFMKALNISNANIEKFEKLHIPRESRKKLLLWTKSEFNLSTRNVLELLKNKCSGSTCLPDIGELCCPW